jgi:hypothetical protein
VGILLFSLLVGVVMLEEIERIPADEWRANGLRHVWRLRRTRNRMAFLLALAAGAFFLWFELRQIFLGRSTFHPVQALALFGVLAACFVFALVRKGPR